MPLSEPSLESSISDFRREVIMTGLRTEGITTITSPQITPDFVRAYYREMGIRKLLQIKQGLQANPPEAPSATIIKDIRTLQEVYAQHTGNVSLAESITQELYEDIIADMDTRASKKPLAAIRLLFHNTMRKCLSVITPVN